VGTTTIDLRSLPSPTAPERLEVDRNVGSLRVLLPRGLAAAIDDASGIGSVNYNERQLGSGVGQHVHQPLNPGASGQLFTLVVRGTVGTVRIEQPT
jgi:predicted membrane protein